MTVSVRVPIKISEYQYVQLECGTTTTIRINETYKKAFKRAWSVAETEVTRKRDEYESQL